MVLGLASSPLVPKPLTAQHHGRHVLSMLATDMLDLEEHMQSPRSNAAATLISMQVRQRQLMTAWGRSGSPPAWVV